MNGTIAAISTAASGPIGILRISGPETLFVLGQVFSPRAGGAMGDKPPRTMVYGDLKSRKASVIDHCLAVYMPGPNSYTGEDMAEIQCHGSIAILNEALAVLFTAGAIPAQAGEFTKRAFINGKLDLSEAEAVHDLIKATTTEAAENAAAQLDGVIAENLTSIRETILGVVAHFYALVDYPDEDIDPFIFENAQEVLHNSTKKLYRLAESFEKGRLMKEGIPCVILGKPNAGKSSLLNRMAGKEKAIVTDIAGTTRDLIEESIKAGPVLLRMTDTAGLRETTDEVEKIGVERAISEASGAALVLAVFDNNAVLTDDDMMVIARTQGKQAIAVINKCDLDRGLDFDFISRHFQHIVEISTKTGEGIETLFHTITQMVGLSGVEFNGEIVTNARQAAALTRAAQRCEEAFFAAQTGMTPDAVVMDAEGAIAVLGEVTGQSVTEDIVSKIFENFCVGK